MRDHRIDNAKGVLIFLVVLGHYLETVTGWLDPVIRGPLTFAYMFHMPAFVFLAGMTAKPHQLGKRIATLAVLLVAFQLAYTIPFTIKDGAYPVSPLQPFWILWFLLSMIWWLALLPLILRLPAPLLTSIGIAIAAGAIPLAGYPLSASRTLVFLPFFVAGNLYGRQILQALPTRRLSRPMAAGLLLALAGALYAAGIGHPWLSGFANFDALGVDWLAGSLTRSALLLTAAAATMACLSLCPATNGVLARIGRASMAVFLLHGFCVVLGGPVLRAIYTHLGPIPTLAAAIFGAAAVTFVLGRDFFDSLIRRAAAAVVDRAIPGGLPAKQ